jgi:hypothetical protein
MAGVLVIVCETIFDYSSLFICFSSSLLCIKILKFVEKAPIIQKAEIILIIYPLNFEDRAK